MGDGLGALEAEGSALPAGFSWSSPWSPQVQTRLVLYSSDRSMEYSSPPIQ
jgi:hypothetical protein